MNKNRLLTSAFISVLLLSAIAGTILVNLGKANPFYPGENTPPPEGTQPPKISLFFPNNNTASNSNNIALTFDVNASEDTDYLTAVYYQADWLEDDTSIYHLNMKTPNYNMISEFSYNTTLTNLPDGNHNLTVIASAHGAWVEVKEWTYHPFDIGGSSSVFFSIDTTPPDVSVLSLENRTYDALDIPLNFTVNESVSRMAYSLDGAKKVTVNGNATLNGLSYGAHSLTIYARDTVGNMGASETIYFTTEEPFPTEFVIVAGASVGFVSFWLIVFSVMFRRKTENHEKTNISGRDDSQKNNIKGGEA